MDKTKQRIEIAKFCGWKNIIFRGICEPKDQDYAGQIREGWQDTIPDYLNDLNAIHNVENFLETYHTNLCYIYSEELKYIINKSNGLVGNFRLLNSTAEQKCEALLKTIKKWKE